MASTISDLEGLIFKPQYLTRIRVSVLANVQKRPEFKKIVKRLVAHHKIKIKK